MHNYNENIPDNANENIQLYQDKYLYSVEPSPGNALSEYYRNNEISIPGRKNKHGIKKIVITGLIIILGLYLLVNIDMPFTNDIRTGIKDAIYLDLDIDKAIGELVYIYNDTFTNKPVSGGIDIESFVLPVKQFTIKTRFSEHNDFIELECGVICGVYACADGQVLQALDEGVLNLVKVRHSNGLISEYSCLDEVYVHEGQKVKAGTLLASVADGSQGRILRFRLIKDNISIDPLEYYDEAI